MIKEYKIIFPEKRTHIKKRDGFTLVEISIVLVIIGLLVGGIIIGKDLIKASEIRAQISQIEEFKTAANTFRLKYGWLPGDIPPAEANQLGFFTFTGTYAGKEYLGAFVLAWGYYRYGYGDSSSDIQPREDYVFWQHLSEAELIGGQYGGSVGGANYLQADTSALAGGRPVNPTPNYSDYDIFQPQSKFASRNTHISVEAILRYTKFPSFINTSYTNLFGFYATPYQEFSIDSKIDDGNPNNGAVRDAGARWNNLAGGPPCIIKTVSPMTYDLTPATVDTINRCMINMLW